MTTSVASVGSPRDAAVVAAIREHLEAHPGAWFTATRDAAARATRRRASEVGVILEALEAHGEVQKVGRGRKTRLRWALSPADGPETAGLGPELSRLPPELREVLLVLRPFELRCQALHPDRHKDPKRFGGGRRCHVLVLELRLPPPFECAPTGEVLPAGSVVEGAGPDRFGKHCRECGKVSVFEVFTPKRRTRP